MVVQHHTGIDKGLNSLSGLLSLPNMAFSTYRLFVQYHVMRTVSCYPIAWAMRIVDRTGNNPYYILKDHLGYASVVTDASGVTVREGRSLLSVRRNALCFRHDLYR